MSKKQPNIDSTLEKVKTAFGEESVMTLGDKPKANIDVIATGLLSLDNALGIKGIPKGRIVEIYGPESSGKTTLTLEIINQAQKQKLNCAFIDAEHSLDPTYAKELGVELPKLIFSQPDSGEQALAIVESLIKSDNIDLIIVDSVAALVPQVELDGEMSDQTIGVQARLMSKALRKIAGLLRKHNATIIFINQIRIKIGIMFGNPETTPGGRALKFYSSIRIEVRGSTKINQGSEIVGNEVKIKIVKNKLAPPFKTVMASIIYGTGFDNLGDLISLAVEKQLIDKSGSWYSYNKKKVGQGIKSVKQWLIENPKIQKEIKGKLG